MNKVFADTGWEDYLYWQTENRKILKKINQLINDIMEINKILLLFQSARNYKNMQSTLNYNMPLRGLIYYDHNIDGILKSNGISLYGKKIVKIPAP